jgi:hypothetical protein
MIRWMSAAVVSAMLCATTGCSGNSAKTIVEVSPPDAFAGAWRSVTPSLEFIRLSVASTSSQMGVMAARLTLSGLAWEGGGRIDGDSLVIGMTTAGTAVPIGTIVLRARDANTLRLQMRPAGAATTDLTFVRED